MSPEPEVEVELRSAASAAHLAARAHRDAGRDRLADVRVPLAFEFGDGGAVVAMLAC